MNNKLPFVPLAKYLFDSNDLPWMWPLPPWATPQHRALRRLRRVGRRKLRSEVIERYGWFRMFTQVLAWPFVSTLKAFIALKGHPGSIPAKLRQFTAYCWLQWAHNIRISDQQELLLTAPQHRKQVRNYMQWRENQALINLTKERFVGYPEIHEKRGFARFCTEFDLPAPPLLADGEGTKTRILPPWPKADLVLKPSDLGWGKGIEILHFHPAPAKWRGQDGVELDTTNISAYASKQYGGGPWMLQPRVKNADSWSHLTPGALATIRVTTGRPGRGANPVVMGAFLRLPRLGSIVDNFSAGGLAVPLDPQTGRLSNGHTHHPHSPEHASHPDTGVLFAGKTLPDYKKILSLAIQAHRLAGEWTSIGWDITLTDDGPQMIEANLNWSIVGVSRGKSPYIEVMQKALDVT